MDNLGDSSIFSVGMESVYRKKNTKGVDNCLVLFIDAEKLKHEEQIGLDTLVVHALTYEC